jgi:hypothetical protein
MKIKAEPVQIEELSEDKTIQIYTIPDFFRKLGLHSGGNTTFIVKADEIMNVKCHYGLIRCIHVVSIISMGVNITKENIRYDGKTLLLNIGMGLNKYDINDFEKIDEFVIDDKRGRECYPIRDDKYDYEFNTIIYDEGAIGREFVKHGDKIVKHDDKIVKHEDKIVKKGYINKYKIIIPLLMTVSALFITKMIA